MEKPTRRNKKRSHHQRSVQNARNKTQGAGPMNATRRHGFSLLDVVVSVALAAILSLLIFQALQQTRRAVKKIQATVDVNSMLIHFKDRIFKDIQGTFIPQNPSQQRQQQQINPTAIQTPEKKDDQEALRYYLLEPINITEKAEGDHGTWSFVTTSSLNIYDAVSPRAVRILYELKKLPDTKKWQLSRLESAELDYKKFTDFAKSKPGIIILNNIESITVTCYAQKKKEAAQTPQSTPDKPQQKEESAEQLSPFTAWNSDERKKDKQSQLPEYIKITGSIREEHTKTPVDFSFMIPLEAVAGNGQTPSILDQLANLFPELQTPVIDDQKTPASTLFPPSINGRR
jgi:type II secretory pathway pseudopilin PulG